MLIYVSNILVNNQPFSATAIKVTDQFPTINWVYGFVPRVETDPGGSGDIIGITTALPYSYKIRIGASSTNLGNDSYTGNLVNQITPTISQNTSYRYTGNALTIGSTYYGQIQITDNLGNISSWATFIFQYNTPPTVSNVSISPSVPSVLDILLLSYTFFDADGDLENGSKIWWFKNGVHQRHLDGYASIQSSNLSYGDQWYATVYPSDGYTFGQAAVSSTVSVLTTPPILDTLQILPILPTINDPLYAKYNFTGQLSNKSTIKWYINGYQATGFSNNLARLPVNIGDVVYYEVTASDGVSTGSTYASNRVIISDAPYTVSRLRINNEEEPLNVATLTPYLSWVVSPVTKTPTFYTINIGTAAGANNIFSITQQSSVTNYNIPSNILQYGNDYYLSVIVGDTNGVSDPSVIHFRTQGSLWQQNVSNNTGWTIETTFRVNSGYQGFRISDGTQYAEIRFYPNQVQMVSGQTTTVFSDFSNFSTITITGQGNNINIYQHYNILINGTGLFSYPTTNKTIQFGSINITGSSSADYIDIYYNINGAFAPGDSLYTNFVYNPFYQIDGTINYITSANNQMYFSASTDEIGSSSNIYQVLDYIKPVKATTVNKTFSPINRINTHGKYTYFSHSRGATVFSNYIIPYYDSSLNFQSSQNTAGWEIIDNLGSITYSASGMNINSFGGGEAYLTQKQHGTPWFDKVSNPDGWTISFSLTVSALNNDRKAENTDLPDGFGVYINDGSYNETIFFYPNEIYFANSQISTQYNTTFVTNYTIVGKNNEIKIFASQGSASYSLIATSAFFNPASNEGNAGRPSIFEDSQGNEYAVWHDDGGKYSQIYYSYMPYGGVWEHPQCIVSIPFGAKHPDIACDSTGTVYVVYEDEQNDYTNIGIVVQNQYGWSNPYTITSGILDSLAPRIAIDSSNNVHITWFDYQEIKAHVMYMKRTFTTGNWSQPIDISLGTNPAIVANGTNIYISYTNNGAISLSLIQSGAVSASTLVSSGYSQADFSDIAIQNGIISIAWHDIYNTSFNEYEIFARQFTTLLLVATGNQQQITSSSLPSKFPCLGAKVGNDIYTGNVYLVWEFNGDQIDCAYYDHNLKQWRSDDEYGSTDIIVYFDDLRVARRPRIAKSFANSAHILYETEMATTDEYLTSTDNFTIIRDAVWDLAYFENIYPFGSTDIHISGILPRKEIRFGDFSQNINGNFVFGYFQYYTQTNVEPFNIALISTSTQPILDNHSFCSQINRDGDAWIGTEKGLSFYFRESNQLANAVGFSITVRAVVFDRNGTMYVGTDSGQLYTSSNHTVFISPITLDGPITDLAIDPDNLLWIAVYGSGVYQLSTTAINSGGTSSSSSGGGGSIINTFNSDNGLPSNNIFRVKSDDRGTIWVCTDSGLVSISTTGVSIYNKRNSSIPSDRVNDIAIVSSSTRYIATSSGIALMTGNIITPIEIADPNWNGNIKSIAFTDPNTIWAGTMSYLFQITVTDGNYTWTSYSPSMYTLSASTYDDLSTYYIVGLNTSIDPSALIEVYVNNRLINHGYTISTNPWIIHFISPLNRNDIVTVTARTDILNFATLEQNQAQQIAYGPVSQIVNKFVTDGNQLYVATEGNNSSLLSLSYANSISGVDGYSGYPMTFASIGLDTTPPVGTLVFEHQIDANDVLLDVEYYGDNLSGIASMQVSNYSNFTSDGTTPLPWIPFSPSFAFNLGTNLGLSSTQLTFTTGQGARIALFTNSVGVSTLLAGASYPARIFSYNSSNEWTLNATLDLDQYGNANPLTSIEFILTYNSSFIVGTGTSGGTGKVFISSDGVTFNLLASVDGDHAYSATIFNNILYIGTGPNGIVYSYDGTTIKQVYSGMGTNIYSLAGYGSNIYLATGEQGRLFQWNPLTNTAIIFSVDADTELTSVIGCFVTPPATGTSTTGGAAIVTSIAPQNTTASAGGSDVIFYGTGNTSKIMKSEEQSPFYTSFVTVTGHKISFLKIINSILYAGIGQTLLYYGNDVWLTQEGDTDIIHDAYIDGNGNIWTITDSAITLTITDVTQKMVYFRLQDRAGNISATSNTPTLPLSIANLQGFINSDRILELDEYGAVVSTYDGSSTFYSAGKVETETGTYTSTVFNGTNDQVSWGTIYWNAVIPDGCSISVGVRTATSRDILNTTSWTYYNQSESSGVDISNYSGQYIQFTVIMSSTIRGLSPSLYKVVITSVIKASVHFFTTNFILPSPVTSGILTSQQILPVSADIVFGIDTNNSVDFSTYQIIKENSVFSIGPNQIGKNLRIGVQLIAPVMPSVSTDFYPDYDAYGSPSFVNVVDFNYVCTTNGNINFSVTFYSDSLLTNQVAVLSTAQTAGGWSVNNLPFPSGGFPMTMGNTANIICSIANTSALRCDQYYWVVVKDNMNTIISNGEEFIAGCNPSFIDSLSFDFTNTEGSTYTFNFRVQIYTDPERTNCIQTFFSGSSDVGWTESNIVITNGQTVGISLTPDTSSLTVGQVYYLVVDAFDGTNFSTISNGWTFKTVPLSSGSCGEYTNVPVLKNLAIMFEMADGSQIMLNT